MSNSNINNGPNKSNLPKRAERVATRFPVVLNDFICLTRDVSSTGIFLEVDEKYLVGSRINFQLDLLTEGEVLKLDCDGEIVRVEINENKMGIAVKILEKRLS